MENMTMENNTGYVPEILWLDSVGSTNTVVRGRIDGLAHGCAVCAREQTAGRGQRGNSWEAAPGMNVTMSILLRPAGLRAVSQFSLSQAVSMGIVHAVRELLGDGMTQRVCVKWPNDIYVDDMKLCGILIENSIAGDHIAHSIVGVGLNVNQCCFVSDAPNPVSLCLIDGVRRDVDDVARRLVSSILAVADAAAASGWRAEWLAGEYRRSLWRAHGYHPYRDVATGSLFYAMIDRVADDGMLHLVDRDGLRRVYAFKEVAAQI